MEYLWISLQQFILKLMLLVLGRQLYFGKGEYIGLSPLIDYPILFLCRHGLLTEIHVIVLPSPTLTTEISYEFKCKFEGQINDISKYCAFWVMAILFLTI